MIRRTFWQPSLLICSCLLPFLATADMLSALKAYENKQYTAAASQFADLVVLGNETAVFNLAVMAYQGQGEPVDWVKAAALFTLAEELQHPDAGALQQTIVKNFSSAQQTAVATQLAQWRTRVQVGPAPQQARTVTTADQRAVLSRAEPHYPKAAALQHISGVVVSQLLVDESGAVIAVDPIVAYPPKVFEKTVSQALKRWRYQPAGQKTVHTVTLSLTLGQPAQQQFEQQLTTMKLWQYAALGSPAHQFILSRQLQQISDGAAVVLRHDPALAPRLGELPAQLFASPATEKIDPSFQAAGPLQTFVRVDPHGVITAVLATAPAETQHPGAQPQAATHLTPTSALVGKKVRLGAGVAAEYQLSIDPQGQAFLRPAVAVPYTLTADYWLNQAARGGERLAQRMLAAQLQGAWQAYLLSQQDPATLAWHGATLLTNGNSSQGRALLQQAITLGYPLAGELNTLL